MGGSAQSSTNLGIKLTQGSSHEYLQWSAATSHHTRHSAGLHAFRTWRRGSYECCVGIGAGHVWGRPKSMAYAQLENYQRLFAPITANTHNTTIGTSGLHQP